MATRSFHSILSILCGLCFVVVSAVRPSSEPPGSVVASNSVQKAPMALVERQQDLSNGQSSIAQGDQVATQAWCSQFHAERNGWWLTHHCICKKGEALMHMVKEDGSREVCPKLHHRKFLNSEQKPSKCRCAKTHTLCVAVQKQHGAKYTYCKAPSNIKQLAKKPADYENNAQNNKELETHDVYPEDNASLCTKNCSELNYIMIDYDGEHRTLGNNQYTDGKKGYNMDNHDDEEEGDIFDSPTPRQHKPLPKDCEWGSWSDYGQCSKNGLECTKTRKRHEETAAEHGGVVCTGESTETANCNTEDCPEFIMQPTESATQGDQQDTTTKQIMPSTTQFDSGNHAEGNEDEITVTTPKAAKTAGTADASGEKKVTMMKDDKEINPSDESCAFGVRHLFALSIVVVAMMLPELI